MMMFHCYGYGIHLMKRVKTLAKDVNEHPVEADVHALRVAVKQLNALVSMLAYYNKDLDRHRLKRMRKLFHAAGILREWQLLDKRISGYHPVYEEAALRIHKEIQLAYAQFRHHYKCTGKSYFKDTGRYLQSFYKKASKLKLGVYFNHKEEDLKSALNNENQSSKRFHKVRMLLKELKYNVAAVNIMADGAIPRLHDLHFLNQCDKLLGNWHDLQVVVIQLDILDNETTMSGNAKAQLLQLKENAAKKADEILNQFIHDMHQLSK